MEPAATAMSIQMPALETAASTLAGVDHDRGKRVPQDQGTIRAPNLASGTQGQQHAARRTLHIIRAIASMANSSHETPAQHERYHHRTVEWPRSDQ